MTDLTPEWMQPEDTPIVPDHTASKDPYEVPVAQNGHKSGPTRTGSILRATRPGEKRAKAPKGPPPENKPGQFVEPLTDFYNTVAIALMPFKPAVAMTIMTPAREDDTRTVAENCAIAWDEAAQKNESIRRALKTFTTIGVYGALFIAHAPIFMAGIQGTELEKRFNPAAAMEDMLRKEAEKDTDV